MNATHLTYSSLARGKPLRFHLVLELHAPILPDASSYSTSAAGRITFWLTKDTTVSGTGTGAHWSQLTAAVPGEGVRQGAITTWYEMQELLGGPGTLGAADEPDAVPPPSPKPSNSAGKGNGGAQAVPPTSPEAKAKSKGGTRGGAKGRTTKGGKGGAKPGIGERVLSIGSDLLKRVIG